LGDFISCAFKHTSISKEVNIMAIDYQQNQVHSSLQEYGHELHTVISRSSKYIWELGSKMPELSVAVSATTRDLASLQQLEEALVAKQEALRALTQQNAKGSPRPDSLEEINDQSQLNRQLEALEQIVDKLEEGMEMSGQKHLESLADDMTNSLWEVMLEELQQSETI
ncbi:unnamed protein product, partial [Polarella glacialis]